MSLSSAGGASSCPGRSPVHDHQHRRGSAQQLLLRADDGLYAAKRAGRDCALPATPASAVLAGVRPAR